MRTFRHFILLIAVLLLKNIPAEAQFKTAATSMDTDFMQFRANAFPDASFTADDCLQYAPAAVLLLTKTCGYEGRSSWGRMLASDAFSGIFMVGSTYALKYGIARQRPDGSGMDSFPSGHCAKAFAFATMLHKEYSWKCPWLSISGYSIAAATALMRMANNKHWLSDTFAGALIGIGSVHLGYWISDLIFKERHLGADYVKPEFQYDPGARIYDIDLMFSRRFMLASSSSKAAGLVPERGSDIAVNASLPIIPRAGVSVRLGAGVLGNENLYNVLAGGSWNLPFGKRGQVSTYLLAGYARLTADDHNRSDLIAGCSLALCIADHYKLKAFAEYENIASFHGSLPINSILLGFSSGFYF